MAAPPYVNQSLNQIVDSKRHFISSWFIWKSLAWLDYAKRNTNASALQYAALELRQGIEQLWFDIIITAVGGRLDIKEYSHCKRNATKMYKIIRRLLPDYQKLVRFTNICGSLDLGQPKVVEWDMPRLIRIHGETSEYLHFYGVPNETTEKPEWFVKVLTTIERGADYVWKHLTTAHVGQMNVASMPPEVNDVWNDFRTGKITEGSTLIRLKLAQPILHNRRMRA
jgi:hypothetical protein